MYIYIENNFQISLDEVLLIINYEELKNNNNKYLKKNEKTTINLSENEKRTAIITEKYIYITETEIRSIKNRSQEYLRMKEKGKLKQ